MSPTTRLHGGGVSGTSTCGFLDRSVVPATLLGAGAWLAHAPPPPATGPWTAGLDSGVAPVALSLLSSPPPLLLPQPARAAVSATARSVFLTSWTPGGSAAACRGAA